MTDYTDKPVWTSTTVTEGSRFITVPEAAKTETHAFVTKIVMVDPRAGAAGLLQYNGKVISHDANTVTITEEGTNDTVHIALETISAIRRASQIKTAKPRLI